MKSLINYFKSLFEGIWNLLLGLKISMTNLLRKKVTEKYPENRKTRKEFERFRAQLTMPHNDKNEHKCIACGICAKACPMEVLEIVEK